MIYAGFYGIYSSELKGFFFINFLKITSYAMIISVIFFSIDEKIRKELFIVG